jgi:hypothetical protein
LRRRAALFALALILAAGPARAGLADRIGATFGLMEADLVKAFVPREGMIVAIDGATLYLDFAAKDGVQVGQEFTVFRKGGTFRHPLTGQPLGRYEDVLGYAHVVRVEPKFTQAKFVAVDGKPEPEVEDGVRITRGRIKVAVTPLIDLTRSAADLRRVPFLLSSALDRTKRFQVADPLAVLDLLGGSSAGVEEMLAQPQKAIEQGKALDVAWWLVPMLIQRGGVTYLDATWISAITGSALISRRQVLTRPEPAEEQRFPWEPAVED